MKVGTVTFCKISWRKFSQDFNSAEIFSSNSLDEASKQFSRVSTQFLFLSQVLIEAFSMIVRVIRMYVSKRVKILLLALIVVLLDILKHDLTKFLHYSCFICNYRERPTGFEELLGFLELILQFHLSRAHYFPTRGIVQGKL